MAAPVGHIVCAMALLNSGTINISDTKAFYAGTSFPDIRYIDYSIERKNTHQLKESSLAYVAKAGSSFEMGRRLHAWVDHRREEHMRTQGAYNFIKNGPYKSQRLKLIEDKILFNKLKNNFLAHEVFDHIYAEEKAYGVNNKNLLLWHEILKQYLDTKRLSFVRYYNAVHAYKQAMGMPAKLFKNIGTSIKTTAFLLYAYVQIEWLSRDERLKAIVLDFYENKIDQLIREADLKN